MNGEQIDFDVFLLITLKEKWNPNLINNSFIKSKYYLCNQKRYKRHEEGGALIKKTNYVWNFVLSKGRGGRGANYFCILMGV